MKSVQKFRTGRIERGASLTDLDKEAQAFGS